MPMMRSAHISKGRAHGLVRTTATSCSTPSSQRVPCLRSSLRTCFTTTPALFTWPSTQHAALTTSPHHPHSQQRPDVATAAIGGGSKASGSISLFPAGAKQASVVLPAIMLQITADALMSAPETTLDQLSRAIRAGATAVVLSEGSGGGASALYEAAVKLKELVTGRAALLIVDRMDIAQAVDADGVLLTESGIPTVVAKRMLAGTGGGLVGRTVSSVQAATQAAADGANLLLLRAADGGPPDARAVAEARKQQRSGNPIPVLLSATSQPSDSAAVDRLADVLAAGASGGAEGTDGVAVDLGLLSAAVGAGPGTPVEDAVRSVSDILIASNAPTQSSSRGNQQGASNGSGAKTRAAAPAVAAPPATTRPGAGTGTWSRRLLAGSASEQLLGDERQLLAEVTAFLEEVVPDLPELTLLRDATKQLDEPFLVVVVGEFNSGKSSVINALLGNKFLAEGILPTTNEISVLRFSDEPGAEARLEQQADGLYVRYLPARLLEEMQIVDTPGTNVILERQQRLTEEYVPRADLVLFVMSADRPFSESEVRFLEYIRQWRKKVVFVINKADMLESMDEVEEVKSFVADNARRLLRLDDPPVIAVSSRAAIRAKMAARKPHKGSVAPDVDGAALAGNPDWARSGFGAFEHLIYAFLIGDAEGGSSVAGSGEGVRLKLQTPLFVADALVGAAGKKLEQELTGAQAELASVQAISRQLQRFAADMEKDASAQRDALLKVLAGVTGRMDGYIDRTLALSNAVALVDYIAGPKSSAAVAKTMAKFEAEAVGFDRVRDSVLEHASWLAANCESQRNYYRGFVEARVEEALAQGRDMTEVEAALAALPAPSGAAGSSAPVGSNGLVPVTASSSNSTLSSTDVTTSSQGGQGTTASISPQDDFDLRAAATLLEEELREAVVGTATTALGAPALGLVVTSVIDNAFEDLLVLGAAGAAAYASVLNLPLRRAEIKGKVAKLASEFVSGVQDRMKQALDQQVGETIEQVEALAAPLERSAAAEVERLEQLEQQRRDIVQQLTTLGQRAANLE